LKGNYEIAHYIASLAQRAVLYEVSVTPKPGLVDRDNSGAHRDMDFFTFMSSSSALYRGMFECALTGLSFDDSDSTKLLDQIRGPGIECEKAMLEATGGVNTHKGIIFSMGVLCAVVGNIYRKTGTLTISVKDICREVKEVAKKLVSRDFAGIYSKSILTHGEKLFKEYGYTGIRGEVESGFKTVQDKAVHIIREWHKKKQFSMNDMLLQVLMSIITENTDTNVITRGGLDGLIFLKSAAGDFLKAGGLNQPDAKERLQIMNTMFIRKNLSPGGSADLLAVSIFFAMVEGIIK
jgi:triphosphoribosyl-dephospho-CoA synthase